MTASAQQAPSLSTPNSRSRSRAGVRRRLALAARLIVGSLLCLTPLTAIVALGWMQRVMRREAAITLFRRAGDIERRQAVRQLANHPATAGLADSPGWFFDRGAGGSWLRRYLGGLWANISEGVMAAVAMTAMTLPFAVVWLGSWWAGWENSFNKGYEQSAAGPLAWLAGSLFALIILRYLPMATAHVSAERRLSAVVDVSAIRRLTGAAGLSLIWPSLVIALGSLAVLALGTSPIILQAADPGFGDLDAAAVERLKGTISFASATVVFVAALLFRVSAARAYGRALHRLGPTVSVTAAWHQPVRKLAGGANAGGGMPRMPSRLTRLTAALANVALSVIFVAALLVGQFMNHSWRLWVTFPVFGVPWLP